jgi:tRNA threonylcarbamoyl adenosine modification protein (Sua5/YciO/YrdC/YwlC family)
MVVEINRDNINQRSIEQIIAVLTNDGVIIIPTDTVYALACSIKSNRAFEKICRFKNVRPEKANFSFLCNDLKDISFYTKPFDRSIYKLLNKNLPGAFTFILEASSNVPSIFRSKKKTIGIRIPNHAVTLKIIETLGWPLMATSLHNSDDPIADYLTDPKEIFENFENDIDLIVDSGNGGNMPSTVVDCASGEAVIIRQGLGEL